MNILEAPFIKELCKITNHMYQLGLVESNGGNISYLLLEDELKEYLDTTKVIRTIPLSLKVKELSNMCFLVTGTGAYFREIANDPEKNLGIIRISDDGVKAELIWGYRNNGKFTSELPSHLLIHLTRLKINPKHRVVIHAHPTNVIAMSQVHTLEDKEFTKSLWKVMTECMLTFPDGIGVLPWMLCGTNEIAIKTAEKMNKYRIVIWAFHGINTVGNNINEAFGLIEIVEKAAEIYLKVAHLPKINTLTNEQ